MTRQSRMTYFTICHQSSYIDSDSVIILLSWRLWTHMSQNHTQTAQLVCFCICVYVCESAPDGSVHVKLFIRPNADELCVFVHACQWPRGTAGPRNYLNGHSCISIATGCFNGGTLWAREQGNDRSGRRNALILSQWQEGMLPLSDGLIAPALIDRHPRPLRSPGNTGPPLPRTQKRKTRNTAFLTLTVSCFLERYCILLIITLAFRQIGWMQQVYQWWKCNQRVCLPGEEETREWMRREQKRDKSLLKTCLWKNGLSLFGTLTQSRTRIPSWVSHSTAECIHAQIL